MPLASPPPPLAVWRGACPLSSCLFAFTRPFRVRSLAPSPSSSTSTHWQGHHGLDGVPRPLGTPVISSRCFDKYMQLLNWNGNFHISFELNPFLQFFARPATCPQPSHSGTPCTRDERGVACLMSNFRKRGRTKERAGERALLNGIIM